MKRICKRYLLFLCVICIFLTGCLSQDKGFAVVDDPDEIQDTQAEHAEYWQTQFNTDGTKVVQVSMNTKIGETQTHSLYDVMLSRCSFNEENARQWANMLFDNYKKQEASEDGYIEYIGYKDNIGCELSVSSSRLSFKLSNPKDGLYNCPEGNWYTAAREYHYWQSDNQSEITPVDAEQIADDFLEEVGLDGYQCAAVEDIYWLPVEETEYPDSIAIEDDGSISENTWCEGYALTYARDIHGIQQDVQPYYDAMESDIQIIGGAYDEAYGEAVNENLEQIVIYVTDFGVISFCAENICTVDETALDGTKTVGLEEAKKLFEKILTEDSDRFSAEAVNGKLEFNRLELVYYADAPNHISPAWKLSNWVQPEYGIGSEETGYQEICRQVILIHAISGEEIDPKVSCFSVY